MSREPTLDFGIGEYSAVPLCSEAEQYCNFHFSLVESVSVETGPAEKILHCLGGNEYG